MFSRRNLSSYSAPSSVKRAQLAVGHGNQVIVALNRNVTDIKAIFLVGETLRAI